MSLIREADTRTLADLAREALQVQDACNLSGVIHGFSRAISQLRVVCPDQGTEFYNTHPICRLWASKVHDLARLGCSNYERYDAAYTECQRIAEGNNP